MSTSSPRTEAGRRHTVILTLIATVGSITVAAIAIIPPLLQTKPEKEGGSSKPTQTAVVTGNGSVAVAGDHAIVTVGSSDKLEGLLKERLPVSDHPVIDLSMPVSGQVQLFAEDKVRIPGLTRRIRRVWFGGEWLPFDYDRDYNRVFTVWGVPGEPITPKFDPESGEGMIKLEVSYTRYLDKPRDIRQRGDQSTLSSEVKK